MDHRGLSINACYHQRHFLYTLLREMFYASRWLNDPRFFSPIMCLSDGTRVYSGLCPLLTSYVGHRNLHGYEILYEGISTCIALHM